MQPKPNIHQRKISLQIIGLLLLLATAESFHVTPTKSSHSEIISYRSRHSSAHQMSTTDAEVESKAQDTSPSSSKSPKNKDRDYAMPWSVTQNDALRNNLSKYTVRIPLKASDKPQVFGLWRTMLKEVPELAGYPIDFLQEMHALQMERNETLLETTPGLLPFLEDYEFATAGGVSGNIFGVPGLADGTRITTSEVSNVEATLPQGFVRTTDGSAAYEVGKPKRQALDLSSSSTETLAKGGQLLKSVSNTAGGALEEVEGDAMLVRLGASTAILLAGATAVNMLSHHLTVNVFWV